MLVRERCSQSARGFLDFSTVSDMVRQYTCQTIRRFARISHLRKVAIVGVAQTVFEPEKPTESFPDLVFDVCASGA